MNKGRALAIFENIENASVGIEENDHVADIGKKAEKEDCISRQAAIRAVNTALFPKINTAKDAEKALRDLPPAQPERTCVNCGRTANNGGWYADGGTRCPIEEHYALPKDGYCHLWEKRSVTDDDYPERQEE